jgi:diguanylate cyclase (GGDEF)-like protein/PAS domain S-box-containing protein
MALLCFIEQPSTLVPKVRKYLIHLFAIIWLLLNINAVQSDELDPVTLQLKWKHQFQFAGYYAAKEKGFYQEAGLDVTIVEAASGVDAAQEVIANRAQYGVGTSELILNRYHGNRVVVLGVIFQHSPLCLVTLASSGIDNVHKLANRNITIEPSSAELFAYLHQEGLTDNTFTLQHHSFDLNDLVSGKTDAMSVYVTDELYELNQKGQKYNLFSPQMSGIDFYGDNFFTLEHQLQKHPHQVEAFREATLRGWRYAMQHPDEIVQLIYDRYSQRHSIEHLQFEAKAMHNLMQPELIDAGYMNIGRWQQTAQTYHELGLLPEHFDVTTMLYFPHSATDFEKLKIKLYYAAAGLSLLSLLSVILFRFYRTVRINEARLNTMFAHAPLSMIVLDEKNRVQGWNAEAEKTFLWSAKDILGKNVMVLVPLTERLAVAKVLATVHKEHIICPHQNINLKKDGSEILCEWLNAPFKNKLDQSNFIICMTRDITEKNRLEKTLKHAAHYDNLTSLPNRALILEKLKQSLETAARQKTKLAILFLDLNGFKAVNDALGHEAGDELLMIIAKRLPCTIRESDYVGRLGGDEFLIILQDVGSLKNAQMIADEVYELVCQPCVIKDEIMALPDFVG